MRKTRRTSKVGENIRDALVDVFRFDLKDVSMGLVSITEVEVSPDLHMARVHMSGFNEEETRKVVRSLHELRGKVRHFLGKRVRMRYIPELDFKYDETPARAGRIEDLLSEVMPKSEPNDDSDDES